MAEGTNGGKHNVILSEATLAPGASAGENSQGLEPSGSSPWETLWSQQMLRQGDKNRI